eukprot:g3784.t1
MDRRERPITVSLKAALYDVSESHHAFVRKSIANFFHKRPEEDVAILTYCVVNAPECPSGTNKSFVFSRSSLCDVEGGKYGSLSYEDLLLSSKFVLVPPGEGVHSYRLFEAVHAGAVPVIVGHAAIPFASFPVLGKRWDRAAFRISDVSDESMRRLLVHLRGVSESQRLDMVRTARSIFREALKTPHRAASTALRLLLHDRIRESSALRETAAIVRQRSCSRADGGCFADLFDDSKSPLSVSVQVPWSNTQYVGPSISIVLRVNGLKGKRSKRFERYKWEVCFRTVRVADLAYRRADLAEQVRAAHLHSPLPPQEGTACAALTLPMSSVEPSSTNHSFRLVFPESGRYRLETTLIAKIEEIDAAVVVSSYPPPLRTEGRGGSDGIYFELVNADRFSALTRSTTKALRGSKLFDALNALQMINHTSGKSGATATTACQPCSEQIRKLVVCYEPQNYALHGFGARFQSFAGSLALALASNRTLFSAPPVSASTSTTNDDGVWMDLFRSPNGCCGSETDTTRLCGQTTFEYVWGSLATLGHDTVAYSGFYHPRALVHAAVRNSERSKKELSEESPATWFAQIQTWLWQPVQEVLAPISRLRRMIASSDGPVLGIHVRHGDALKRTDRSNATLSQYLTAAITLQDEERSRGRDVRTIFVASDSPKILEQVTATTNNPWRVYFDTILVNNGVVATLSDDGWNSHLDDEMYDDEAAPNVECETSSSSSSSPNLSRKRSMLSGIVQDVTLLSDCNYLIGTCMSQIARLSADLMLGGGRMLSDPVALDMPLCETFPAHFFPIEMEWRGFMRSL